MHFDRIRKLFGLKKGANPTCSACSVSNQKKVPLHHHHYERANVPNKRIHMDIAFTEGSDNPFQMYVDDYTRESYLDLLKDKSEVLLKWVDLKLALENRHHPHKVAFIRTEKRVCLHVDGLARPLQRSWHRT